MTPEQAKEFLNALGSKSNGQNGDWVQAACPLAPWLHKGGSDSNPSFGLYAKAGEGSFFKCFACKTGTALDLLQAVEYHGQRVGYPSNRSYACANARLILQNEKIELPTVEEYAEFPKPSKQVFEAWPDLWLDSYDPVAKHEAPLSYLEGRNVPLEVATQFDLRWDAERKMILFPYRTVWGKLGGARGRGIDPNAEGMKKHYDYTYKGINNSRLVWWNEPCLHLDGPVVITEGQFDALRVLERYPKAMACLTRIPTYEKFMRLTTQDSIIYIPDNDDPGIAAVEDYQTFCAKFGIRLKVLKLPDSVKDAGECHPDFLWGEIEPLTKQ